MIKAAILLVRGECGQRLAHARPDIVFRPCSSKLSLARGENREQEKIPLSRASRSTRIAERSRYTRTCTHDATYDLQYYFIARIRFGMFDELVGKTVLGNIIEMQAQGIKVRFDAITVS